MLELCREPLQLVVESSQFLGEDPELLENVAVLGLERLNEELLVGVDGEGGFQVPEPGLEVLVLGPQELCLACLDAWLQLGVEQLDFAFQGFDDLPQRPNGVAVFYLKFPELAFLLGNQLLDLHFPGALPLLHFGLLFFHKFLDPPL
jgi:hypothetical protein